MLLSLFMVIAALLPLQSFADEGDGGASQDPQVTYTTPTRMTPLVGKHCVIDDLNTDLVSVLAGSVGVENVLDTDLNNYMQVGSTVAAGVAYQPIMSVKDMDNVYAAGTPAGFVIQPGDDTSSVLTADVLQMFTIATYLNGVKQEEGVTSTKGAVLGAKVVHLANTDCARLMFYTTKPFDEVQLVNVGIDAAVISNVKIFYAFVGENPMIPVTRNNFTDADCDFSNVLDYKLESAGTADYYFTLTDSDGRYYTYNILSSGLGLATSTFVINVGEDIPANTEVGFMAKTGTLLNLKLLDGIRIAVLDGDLETYATISGLANMIFTAKGALAVKSSTIYEGNGYAGFLIRDNDFLGNVGAIQATMIRTYLDEVETTDRCTNIDIVSADLLGVAGYGMLLMPVTQPFNEIRLCIDGVADAINKLDIISAFYYAVTDSDGDSLTPLDGTAVGEDGSNIEIESGNKTGEGLFATTDDNKYGAMVFENNSIGDHNSYALPPAETDVPKIKFNYAQVRGVEEVSIDGSALDVWSVAAGQMTVCTEIEASVWTLSGVKIADVVGIRSLDNLVPGVYIVGNGKKVVKFEVR